MTNNNTIEISAEEAKTLHRLGIKYEVLAVSILNKEKTVMISTFKIIGNEIYKKGLSFNRVLKKLLREHPMQDIKFYSNQYEYK